MKKNQENNKNKPWTEKYKPTTLNEIYLNENIKLLLNNIITTKKMKHIIINGSNGTGKTAVAQALINELYGKDKYLFINASDDRSFKDVKEKIIKYCRIKMDENIPKIIIFDEADKSIKKTQDSINSIMDEYKDKLYFIFTCNDHNEIINTIQSKCSIIRFPLCTDEQIRDNLLKIIKIENIKYDEEGIKALIYSTQGDMRQALNNLQKCSFEKITKQNVLLMCDLPDPEIVHNIIQYCKKDKFMEAKTDLEQMIANGYAYTDIIRSFIYVVMKYPYEITEQIKLMHIIANTQIQICKELTSLLQLNAMLSRMVMMYKS
jgi:replication factor C subunit 2/4